ncbi:beta-carotene 15,15'-monooxygenase [Oceanobacillus timonensis]|uniref:beta-carotene 15,15'-monooxygenase n=1 Tax=Oceanobacillus timonensis TaxID=1926285 RepID=UPI0009BAF76D|nr:beta-carotene 15,15'-monooxygenase [Oceanobacillus timonensis]
MYIVQKGKYLWLLMLGLILSANYMLYQTAIGTTILPPEASPVVLGSLIDLIIMGPLFFMLYRKNFSMKTAILLAAAGCVLARILIPSHLLAPFATITWAGIAAEAALIVFELLFVFAFFRYLPKIVEMVKTNTLPVIFSFPKAVDNYVRNNPIVHVICSESLVFYYALCSWRKTPPDGITLHKKSSFIALQIMMIHAIIVETFAIHWWLHNHFPVLSIVLLILNVYSVIFLIASIQSIRLNPVYTDEKAIYISFGILKRIKIDFQDIEHLIEDETALKSKLSKDTIDFIAKEFDAGNPDMIIKMKRPVTATLFMGIQKEYAKVAIKSDNPNRLRAIILNKINHDT